MHCLNEAENAVLDFFFGLGDRTSPLYHCAEALYEKFDTLKVTAACALLLELGLLKVAGDTTNYFSLSPAAMGDVGNGYFRGVGNASEHMMKLEKQLVELQLAQDRIQADARVAAAARPQGEGGLKTKK